MEKGILDGIRVIDFGRVLSAPYGTLMLADLGADVVKIERPEGGDDTRSFGPPFSGGISTYFLSVNRGKRSVALDLKSEDGLLSARRLALSADVLVENFRPGVMERLGLGPAELCSSNPGLVYASITGFGRDSDEPGYDLMVQGLSGVPSLTGPPDGEPYKCGASIADLVSGMNLSQAVLAALLRRERTGRGAVVDVPMMDGMLSLLTYHAGAHLNGGQEPTRMGNGHSSIHPFRPYAAADGHINICVGNDRIFRKLCKALGMEWAADPRFSSNPDRVANRLALDALLEPVVAGWEKVPLRSLLRDHGVPCDFVRTVPEALSDARLLSHPHPSGDGVFQSLPLPFHIGGEPRGAARRAPLLGEHTEEVLSEWLS
jgi:crotonobetainyl-CoA:carnitine CoA-transferase CaiB-like acyl-CoA transferase